MSQTLGKISHALGCFGQTDIRRKPSGALILSAWAHVQRRQDVFLAGTSEIDNTDWVISMGHFMGLLDSNWLGIPANRKMTFLRYADFNCIRNGKLVRSGFFCDLIGVMHQMGINPLPPQTGAR